jgi:hypothetical protein
LGCQLHAPAALPFRIRPRHPMRSRLRSGRFAVQGGVPPFPKMSRFLGRPARSLVTILAELPDSTIVVKGAFNSEYVQETFR